MVYQLICKLKVCEFNSFHVTDARAYKVEFFLKYI